MREVGWGYSTRFHLGRFHQPFTHFILLYTFLAEKVLVSIRIPSNIIKTGAPFRYVLIAGAWASAGNSKSSFPRFIDYIETAMRYIGFEIFQKRYEGRSTPFINVKPEESTSFRRSLPLVLAIIGSPLRSPLPPPCHKVQYARCSSTTIVAWAPGLIFATSTVNKTEL